MSNTLSIATVTEAFRLLLTEALSDSGVGQTDVTRLRPVPTTAGGNSGGLPTVGANLYLYQISPNTAFRNADLPTRRSDGSMLQAPRSAYDLNYLLTFYGDEHKFETQALMGSVLRKLHTEPLLSKDRVHSAEENVHKEFSSYEAPNLSMEIESVKISLIPLSLEELSKLWSVFLQTPYTLTLACQASVVFIDSKETPGPALPVQARNFYVRTFRQPLIEKILAQMTPSDPIVENQPILQDYILVLQGKQLLGDVTKLRVGDMIVTPSDISDTMIKISLTEPSPFLADTLRAGVFGVQVIQHINMGTPEKEHKGSESNVIPFVLRPTVTADVAITGSTSSGSIKYHDATLTLNFKPKVGLTQRVVLLLNEINSPIDRAAEAYRFDVKLPEPTLGSPDFVASASLDVKDIIEGDYLVRVQVDGAESPLDLSISNPKVVIR